MAASLATLLALAALAALAAVSARPALALPCQDCPPPGGGGGGTITRGLTVTVDGHGTVSDGFESCTAGTSPCTWTYASGDSADPTPTPDQGYTFTGWSGDCSGSGTCSFTMLADHAVTASFADRTPPPAPNITSPVDNAPPPNGSAQSIWFTRSDGGGATGTSGFRCKVDNSSFSGAAGCTSPWSTGALATGSHTVYVWALDPAGNASAAAARSFKIVNRPDTAIGGTPAEGSVVNTTTTAFTYSSSIGGSTYSCTLDGGPIACNANVAAGEGSHTLTAAAGISPLGDGNTYNDLTPATRHWTVDTQPPDTSIDSAPAAVTSDPAASIGFSGSDPAPGTALHYECKLDSGAYTACTSPQSYPGLAAGAHTVSVRAIDAAGNVDPTPASRTWTVVADADGDGVFTPGDCDDSDASIHPGAVDVPGDGIDQDCSGADAPSTSGGGGTTGGDGTTGGGGATTGGGGTTTGGGGTTTGGGGTTTGGGGTTTGGGTTGTTDTTTLTPKAPGRLRRITWRAHGSRVELRKVTVTGLAEHAKITVTCKGRGCPFKHRRARVRHRKAQLAGLFEHRPLRKGTRIVVKVTAPNRLPRTFHVTIRAHRRPKVSGG